MGIALAARPRATRMKRGGAGSTETGSVRVDPAGLPTVSITVSPRTRTALPFAPNSATRSVRFHCSRLVTMSMSSTRPSTDTPVTSAPLSTLKRDRRRGAAKGRRVAQKAERPRCFEHDREMIARPVERHRENGRKPSRLVQVMVDQRGAKLFGETCKQ